MPPEPPLVQGSLRGLSPYYPRCRPRMSARPATEPPTYWLPTVSDNPVTHAQTNENAPQKRDVFKDSATDRTAPIVPPEPVNLYNGNGNTCTDCMDWYLSGLVEGQRRAAATDEQIIELAARRANILRDLDAANRITMKSTREYVDVLAARKLAATR